MSDQDGVRSSELERVRRELGVIVRVLEENGIEFNRDEDGYIIGLGVPMSVTLTGRGGYGKA